MAFVPLPLGIKIEIRMRKGGAPNVNVVWGTLSVEIDGASLAAVGEAVVAWWVANIKPLVSTSTTLEEVVVTQWGVADGLQHVEPVSPPSAGTASGGDLPSNVAAVTTFLTPFIGRSNRGRVYNAGLTDAQVTTNTIGTTYVASMLTAWVDFQSEMSLVDCTHVVASFIHEGAPREEGVATPIVTYSMNNVVDTQRRRIPKVNN